MSNPTKPTPANSAEAMFWGEPLPRTAPPAPPAPAPVPPRQKDEWDPPAWSRFADHPAEIEEAQRRSSGAALMVVGALIATVGIVVSVSSYEAAVHRGGGSYVIATGAIAVGAANFLRGLFRALTS